MTCTNCDLSSRNSIHHNKTWLGYHEYQEKELIESREEQLVRLEREKDLAELSYFETIQRRHELENSLRLVKNDEQIYLEEFERTTIAFFKLKHNV